MSAEFFKENENTRPRIRASFCFSALTGMAFLLSGSSAFGQLTLAFAPEYYYWQENANGMKLDDESGVRYWFAKSSSVESGGVFYYQPESISYQASVKMGWTF
jgi:hypothetical protein